jgi:nicotinamide mononucleotide transporter
MSVMELVAVVVTLAAVYLTTRQVIWCWPVGLVGATLYGLIFFEARLYADMGLQGLYFALGVYGWWAWLHGGEDHGELRVRHARRSLLLPLVLGAAIAGLLMGLALYRYTDAALPFLDSTLTWGSIAAQYLQARKLLENWLLWIVVDVVYVGMFVYLGLFLTAALFAGFLVLALMGLSSWRASMRARAVAAPEVAS